jgi:hypothetical protein
MILTRPMRWKRVKGNLERSFLGEATNVRAQPELETEISQLAAITCRVQLCAGRIGQGARYGSSEEERTFGRVILLGCVGGGSYEHVSTVTLVYRVL